MSTVPVVLALTQNCQERERVCLLGACAWVCDTHGGDGGGSGRHAVLIPGLAVLSYFAPKTFVSLFCGALCGAATAAKLNLLFVLSAKFGRASRGHVLPSGGAERPGAERGRRHCRYEEAEVY